MLQGTDTYKELAGGADRSRVHKGNKAVCNPSKVEDHHAIMPTPKRAPHLSQEEQSIYDMIVRRFLSHYYPPAIYKNHTVLTVVEGETFRTKAKEQLDPGWKVVQQQDTAQSTKKSSKRKSNEDSSAADEEELMTDQPFNLSTDQAVHCVNTEAMEKTTQPPKPFTEGTLLKAMESAGKSMEDDELREAMKDTGLGTPATRAATIERLKQVGYMDLSGKRLGITSKGCAAIELIRNAGVELLASPEMTGRWEQRLHQISKGEASDDQFIAKVKQFATMIVDKVRQQRPAAPGTFEERTSGSGKRDTAAGKDNRNNSRSSSGTGSSGSRAGASSTASKPTSSTTTREPIAPCPRAGCTGTIIEGKRGFGCSSFREGCKFVIWKDQQGKTISLSMVKSLIEKGATSQLTFKLEDGSSVKGKLVLTDREQGSLSMRQSDSNT